MSISRTARSASLAQRAAKPVGTGTRSFDPSKRRELPHEDVPVQQAALQLRGALDGGFCRLAMSVLVCGSRTWADEAAIQRVGGTLAARGGSPPRGFAPQKTRGIGRFLTGPHDENKPSGTFTTGC